MTILSSFFVCWLFFGNLKSVPNTCYLIHTCIITTQCYHLSLSTHYHHTSILFWGRMGEVSISFKESVTSTSLSLSFSQKHKKCKVVSLLGNQKFTFFRAFLCSGYFFCKYQCHHCHCHQYRRTYIYSHYILHRYHFSGLANNQKKQSYREELCWRWRKEMKIVMITRHKTTRSSEWWDDKNYRFSVVLSTRLFLEERGRRRRWTSEFLK